MTNIIRRLRNLTRPAALATVALGLLALSPIHAASGIGYDSNKGILGIGVKPTEAAARQEAVRQVKARGGRADIVISTPDRGYGVVVGDTRGSRVTRFSFAAGYPTAAQAQKEALRRYRAAGGKTPNFMLSWKD